MTASETEKPAPAKAAAGSGFSPLRGSNGAAPTLCKSCGQTAPNLLPATGDNRHGARCVYYAHNLRVLFFAFFACRMAGFCWPEVNRKTWPDRVMYIAPLLRCGGRPPVRSRFQNSKAAKAKKQIGRSLSLTDFLRGLRRGYLKPK